MSNEKIKMIMVSAVSKALGYKKANPDLSNEKILEFVIDELDVKSDLKRIGLAAVVRALDYKNEKGSDDRKIMQRIMDEAEDIIKGTEPAAKPKMEEFKK